MTLYKKFFLLAIFIFILNLATLGLYDFHHPSEARYASIAMRIALTGDYLMPYFTPDVPFLGKPPLAFWASAISFKIFGFNEFAGRLPDFIALVAACLFIYSAVKKIYDKETAIISVLILSSCVLFYALHSVMTEAFLFLGMTIISLSFFLQIESSKPKNIYGYLFFVGAAIAMMTKGPVGIFMPCLPIAIYLTYKSKWKELPIKFPLLTGSLIFIALSLPWFLLAENKYPGFLRYFILGENFDRFLKPNWQGDRYGSAHEEAIGMIWWFFAVATFPVILLFFVRAKICFKSIIENCKKDNGFWFFFLSLLIPLVFLTLMRNMIITYAIYSLLGFAVITSRILLLNNWHKFILAIGYVTAAAYILAILLFIAKPAYLEEKLNYQTYLIKEIPQNIIRESDFKLYYFGINSNVFGGYWATKDKVKIINEDELGVLLEPGKKPVFLIAKRDHYSSLNPQYQEKLMIVKCAMRSDACLYKSVD